VTYGRSRQSVTEAQVFLPAFGFHDELLSRRGKRFGLFAQLSLGAFALLRRGSFGSVKELIAKIGLFAPNWNVGSSPGRASLATPRNSGHHHGVSLICGMHPRELLELTP